MAPAWLLPAPRPARKAREGASLRWKSSWAGCSSTVMLSRRMGHLLDLQLDFHGDGFGDDDLLRKESQRLPQHLECGCAGVGVAGGDVDHEFGQHPLGVEVEG